MKPLTKPADDEIHQTLGDSPEAFGRIIRLYQRDIRMFVSRWISCPGASDDIAQDVFVAAYRNFDQFDEHRSLKSWLFGIARNKVKQHLRAESRRRRHELTRLQHELQDWRQQQVSDETFAEGNDQASLATCLGRLAPESRQLIQKHYFEGEALAAIARESNRTGGSLRMMLMRIRKVLAQCIRGQRQK